MAADSLRPIITLPPDMKARLTDLKGDVDRARKAIDTMKKIGMDTRELEEKLEWSEKVRSTLLSEFT